MDLSRGLHYFIGGMATAQPIKLLLVDDHPVILEGLRSMLRGREDMDVVGEAHDGKEAIHQAQSLRANRNS
jgi:chemotaxis response regulator CheB